MKQTIEYKNLEKLMKKHYGNSKTLFFDIGRSRNGIRCRTNGFKNSGGIELLDDEGNSTGKFYDFRVNIQKNMDNKIILSASQNGDTIYRKEIDSLDRVFKLLAHKGELLKTLIEKNLVVDRLTEKTNLNSNQGLGALFG